MQELFMLDNIASELFHYIQDTTKHNKWVGPAHFCEWMIAGRVCKK